MRHQKVITLDAARAVIINELRVRDARKVMAQAKGLEQIDIKLLLTERFDELVVLLGDCVQMPPEETLDDLSFSEVQMVTDGLIEVNRAFLDLLGLAGLVAPNPLEAQQATSTAPASPLSSEGTST
jgi:hypothetical protein